MSQELRTIGCIGCGNMGSAIILGLKKNKALTLMGYDPSPESTASLRAAEVEVAQDLEHLVINCNTIILAVKPYLVEKLLPLMAPLLTPDKIIISVAAGVSQKVLQDGVQNKCAVVRCMPNTPALVGAGIFAFCFENANLQEKDKDFILQLFSGIGMCVELSEEKFPAFSAFIGAGPAYVFHLMNALVQSGVTLGFTRTESRTMVEALFDGSVRMAKASAQSLLELRDNVCSPAGLTIAGVNHLERKAVNGHIVDAVLAAERRGTEMEK